MLQNGTALQAYLHGMVLYTYGSVSSMKSGLWTLHVLLVLIWLQDELLLQVHMWEEPLDLDSFVSVYAIGVKHTACFDHSQLHIHT